MTVVTVLCLIYMLALTGAIAWWLICCSRKERLKRIKGFKKGKFAFIYIAVIPLVFLGQSFNGQTAEGSFWLSVRACIEYVVLKFDYNAVGPLMAENLLYRITTNLLFSLIVLNTFLFTASVCGETVLNHISRFMLWGSKRSAVVVVGTGKNALDLLRSVYEDPCKASLPEGATKEEKKQAERMRKRTAKRRRRELGKAVLLGDITPELKDEAFLARAIYLSMGKEDKLDKKLKTLFTRFDKRKISVILNCEDDAKSLLYAKQLCELISEKKLTDLDFISEKKHSGLSFAGGKGLSVRIYASKENSEVFSEFVHRSMGIIQFVSRHKQIAMDFIDRYPMTQFMGEREIDYDTATIKPEVKLNVLMIGFGKLNESLFLTSVSNHQFLTVKEVDGKQVLVPKPVNYHLYDRLYPLGKIADKRSVASGDLNHGYCRYEEFLKVHKKDRDAFLDLVPLPANIRRHAMEIAHPDFYRSVRTILSNETSYNYIIVSFGTDMQNIELAEKLCQKKKEWNITAPVKIFVKVRDLSLARAVQTGDGDMLFFGSNRGCVYNAETVLAERMEKMAKQRHVTYTAEYEIKQHGADPDKTFDSKAIERSAQEIWYHSYRQFQRESNIYACLNLRMKLQLCGYDYARTGEDRSQSFLTYYTKDNAPQLFLENDRKKIWKYTNAEQFIPSRRWTFAVQEHQRWCANMIASGLVPCTREEIATVNKKELLKKRQHGNITTMEGLVEYRKIMAAKTGGTEEEEDVIRYDFQIMDDAAWLLKACDYILIKRTPDSL